MPKTEKIALLEQLIDQLQTENELSADDLLDTLPEIEDQAELEALLIELADQGLKIQVEPNQDNKENGWKFTPEDNQAAESKADLFDLSLIPVENTLALYLREAAAVPLLSFEEEVALAKQIEKGRRAAKRLRQNSPVSQKQVKKLKAAIRAGLEARDGLIRANTRLVISIAKKYAGVGVPLTDLIQEGNLGLMKAIKKFDYRRGYKFSTYATWWIRQAVSRTLPTQGRTVRIPVHLSDKLRKLHQISRQIEQTWGRKPTLEELAQEVSLTPARVRMMLQASQRPLSLERPVGEEEDAELGDFIEDKDTPAPPDTADHHLLREEINEILTTLPPREAKILRLRFGLQNGESYSLKEIGQKFGLTRERIRQLEQQALRRLRHPRHARLLKDYLA
jgi:RNA polymerase primary sigma factor